MDRIDFIMRLEGDGDLTPVEVIDGIAAMVEDGSAWGLQGFYGRLASNLIENEYIDPDGNVLSYPEEN